MTNVDHGRAAEAQAAEFLKARGYKVLAQNWRTPRCEIDIVALKDKVVYLVEVKYRLGEEQGTGFDYITPSKLKQMEFAAKVWTQQNDWSGDARLLAAEVSGLDFDSVSITELD